MITQSSKYFHQRFNFLKMLQQCKKAIVEDMIIS